MELAHIFGTQAVEEHLRRYGYKVTFPKNMPGQGDLKKLICLKSTDES